MADKNRENSLVTVVFSTRLKDPRTGAREAHSQDLKCPQIPQELQGRRRQASPSATPVVVPEPKAKRKRGQVKRKLAAAQEKSPTASSAANTQAASERPKKRAKWSVTHTEETKICLSRKRSSYRAEDLEAFYRLLEDPVIQGFLEADTFLRVTDKYLLSMVVEYFGRIGLPGHLYNRIHFFLALYIACDMEEDDPLAKRYIFPFLLGMDLWRDLYKDFLKLQSKFVQAMDYRAWVTREICEEIQSQNPDHWIWSRVRKSAP
uniref:speedy protein E4-like n=1 Tax=Jaculus jaculus TaxID=51337 RepID=UPI001E1B1801|nr:speedy protein E4-like [Jaculus jaculus]